MIGCLSCGRWTVSGLDRRVCGLGWAYANVVDADLAAAEHRRADELSRGDPAGASRLAERGDDCRHERASQLRRSRRGQPRR